MSVLTCRSEVLCRVRIIQIQPRQHDLEHAVCVAPFPQRELITQIRDMSALKELARAMGTDALKELARAMGTDALKELARAVGIDNFLSDV